MSTPQAQNTRMYIRPMHSIREAPYVFGVDVGGTKLATVLATRDGQILHKVRLPTEAHLGPAFGVERIKAMLRQNLVETGIASTEIMGIGVACGSPMDAEQGIILGPPNLSNWNPVPIKSILEDEFGIYAQLENDANAGALAEWLFGAGKGKRNVVYMTMGTGIGGGLILDGRLYSGANGNAGEVGHMRVVDRDGPLCGCGKRGCLEAFCSGPSIARRTREAVQTVSADKSRALLALAGSVETLNAEHLFAAARQGDELALCLVDETAHYMGVGLANIIQAINPEAIVLGTIATEQGDFFLDRVRQVVRAESWPQVSEVVEILPSPLGSQVGDYGAISIVLQHLIQEDSYACL
ncbi:MAG: ROK family protein [Anaerolineae bacterium]|nr:ROK family protein [Anaerolineae bacterium]